MTFTTHKFNSHAEWLTWRLTGIGSSDAPIVLGKSRFMTREDLLKQKLSSSVDGDEKKSFIQQRGHEIENYVRKYYSSLIGRELEPVNCQHLERVWQLASLDGGHLDTKTMIEVKLLTTFDPRKGKPRNTNAAGYIKFLEAKAGKIPEDYYPQIQHQLAVTGFDECVFIGYDETRGSTEVNAANTAIVHVGRDDEYIKNLINQETEFWDQVTEARSI